ncbi:MAG: YigZ family protein [Thermomicrobiales bacterium]|nr:YigZ family protein [Thermomicrobiales bacterium]
MALLNRTVARNGQHEIEILKSRFICTIERVGDEGEARAVLERLRKQYWDASHNCYAYVIGETGMSQKASDDGEPSGTAGVPMLEVLRRRELTDLIAVVTRYFGGTKLGAGGLIRAYGGAVSEALDAIGVVERRPLSIINVNADYVAAGPLENAFRASEYEISEVGYGSDVAFTFHLEPDDLPGFDLWLAERTGGQVQSSVVGTAIREVPAPSQPEP